MLVIHHYIMYLESQFIQQGIDRREMESRIDNFNKEIDEICSEILLDAYERTVTFIEQIEAYDFLDSLVIRDYAITTMTGGIDYSMKKSHIHNVKKSKEGEDYVVAPKREHKTKFKNMAQMLRDANGSYGEGDSRVMTNYKTKTLERASQDKIREPIPYKDQKFETIKLKNEQSISSEIFHFLQETNTKIESDIQYRINSLVNETVNRIGRM